jgi:hypothetical protein
VLRRRLVDDLADLRAPGEEDEVPVLVEQRRGFRDRTLDHRYRAGVHVPGDQLGDQCRGGDAHLRWLDHGGVPGRKGRGERAKGQHQRLVPRADDQGDAQRVAADPDVPGFQQQRRGLALGPHPVVQVLEGVLGLLDAEPDVHQIGIGIVAPQILMERGEEPSAVFLQQGFQGFQLLAPPSGRPGGAGTEVLALFGNEACVISVSHGVFLPASGR